MDILLSPGKMRKPTREKIGAFLLWFAVKGFYSEANVALKWVYRAHLRSYGVYGTIVNDVNRKEHELLKQSDR